MVARLSLFKLNKMNKFINLLLVGVLCVGFFACNSDNEEDVGNIQDAEARKFIGKWDGYGYWEFNEDGTCSYSYNSTYNGTWKYEKNSKTLITDVLNWNWQIISISDDQWTGTHLAGKKGTYTYSRVDYFGD